MSTWAPPCLVLLALHSQTATKEESGERGERERGERGREEREREREREIYIYINIYLFYINPPTWVSNTHYPENMSVQSKASLCNIILA